MTQTVGKKLFLVVNPVSGKKLARHYVKGMMERFGEAGFVVTSVYTRKDENAYEKWRKFTQHKKINMENLEYMGDNTYQYTRADGRIALMIIKDSHPINIIFRIL